MPAFLFTNETFKSAIKMQSGLTNFADIFTVFLQRDWLKLF